MSETYCGKSCNECEYKISEQCPGCFEGPGNKEYGACELAKCCRNKGHEKCSMCRFDKECYLLRDKDFMPAEMAKKARVEIDKRNKMIEVAPVLAFWINILLWLYLPSFIGGLFSDGLVSSPTLTAFGMLISVLAQVAYIFVLYKLSAVDKKYRLAGVAMAISLAFTLAAIGVTLAMPNNNGLILSAVVSLAATFASLVSSYYEIFAHADILRGIDNVLGQKWLKLWKMTMIMMGLMLGGGLLMSVVYAIASLMVIASLYISFVVAILKIKYLYNMVKLFKGQNRE